MAHTTRAVAGWVVALTAALIASCAHSQTSDVTMTQQAGRGSSVSITSTATQGAGSSSVSSSSIRVDGSGSDIRVINGRVWIDGEAVPENATRWTARNGGIFRIHREGNQVHIVSE
jgi:hypothetical protein